MYSMFNSVCISVYVKEEVIVDSEYSADLTIVLGRLIRHLSHINVRLYITHREVKKRRPWQRSLL